ncbi:MAG: hypothetical protein JW895_09795 [Thermoleophilaceae bacterium]|nr:hypothetical protein [Thermoleophilaceae bacterium]
MKAPRGRIWIALAVAVAALGAVIFLARDGDRDSPAPDLDRGELPAAAFLDSIGVVVHFNYVDTAYGRRDDVVARLRELGVRHIRDAMPSPVEPLGAGLRAARQAGIRATLATGDVNHDPEAAVRDSLVVMGDAVDAFEGPNELDAAQTGWVATLSSYMPRLAEAVRRQAPGVDLIGPSFIDPDNRSRLPADLPGLANGHPYPGGAPPEVALAAAADQAGRGPGRRGLVFTETGYHNALRDRSDQPPVSEEAAAVYFPRLLLAAYALGARRTFVYELLDEKPEPALSDLQQHFGLLRSDFSPKPAFTAIKTMIAAVRSSPGAGDPAPLPIRYGGEGADAVTHLTLVRPDGSRVVALWRQASVWDRDSGRPERPGRLPVELELGRAVRDVRVWRPSASPVPVRAVPRATKLRVNAGADVTLVSFR